MVTDELKKNKKDAAFAVSFLFGPAVLSVELKAAAGAAANVACDGPEGAGQDDRHSHAPIQASEARDPLLLFFLSPVAGGHRKLSEGERVGFAG
ncbi:hypothetical protein, partial [Stenotrophomonas maltophilia]|uniref:hypothetical protein n=1 Tax=Stenotrophomonas maltophilia TaxID=40324 RepID=UPI0039C41F65